MEPADVVTEAALELLTVPIEEIGPRLTGWLRRFAEPLGVSRICVFRVTDDAAFAEVWAEWTTESPGVGARYSDEELGGMLGLVMGGEVPFHRPGAPHAGLLPIATEERLEALLASAVPRAPVPTLVSIEWTRWPHAIEPLVAELPGHIQRMAEIVTKAHARVDPSAQSTLERRQRLESLGVLAGGLAHDFNNILTVISCISCLLEDFGEDEAMRPLLAQLDDAVGRGAGITQELLLYTRKEPDRTQIVDPIDVVGRMAEMAHRLLPDHTRVDVQVPGKCPPIEVSRTGLEQAVLNLITNASHAMPDGGRIQVTVSRSTDRVEVSVEDEGHGIPAELVDRVREPFFTTKPAGRGTGLGLAMVAEVVERAGGSLQIESEVGVGTTVTLTFPRTRQAAPARVAPDGAVAGGSETILIVEDDAIVRRLSRTILEKRGYTVRTVRDGQAAIEYLATSAPDLLLVDVLMPRMDGRTLFGHYRRFQPTGPVLFFSGFTAGALDAELLADPHCDFVAKPFRPEHLLRAVRALLDAPG